MIRKAAVSIPEPVFLDAEDLARRMKVSRSRLYALALESYIDDYESALLKKQADMAFDAPPSARDDDYLNRMKQYRRRAFKEEW